MSGGALIVEDDRDYAHQFARQVRRVLDLHTDIAHSRQEMRALANGQGLLFMDLRLDGSIEDTIEDVKHWQRLYPLVVVTGVVDPAVLDALADMTVPLLEKGEFKDTMLLYEAKLARKLFERRRKFEKQERVLDRLEAVLTSNTGQG